jgi:hypothetical protein
MYCAISGDSTIWLETLKILTRKEVKINLGNLYFGFLIDYIKKSKGWLRTENPLQLSPSAHNNGHGNRRQNRRGKIFLHILRTTVRPLQPMKCGWDNLKCKSKYVTDSGDLEGKK